MNDFQPGEVVGIPCNIAHGAFPGEYLVTFTTVSGPISGFVPRSELLDAEDDEGTLRGVVVGVDAEENLAVRVVGSFFTTTGLAYLARDWAVSNLQTVK